MVEVGVEAQVLIGIGTLVVGILTSIGVGLKIVGPKIAEWSVDRLDEQLSDPDSKHSKTFDKVVKRAQPALPDFGKIVEDALRPFATRLAELESKVAAVRIPSTTEISGAVASKIPPAPDLRAVEDRIVSKIPSRQEIVDEVVRQVRANLPDPPEIPTAAQFYAEMAPQIANQINSAWSAASAQINASLASLEEILKKGAASAFGKVGADAAKQKVLANKVDQLAKLAGLAEDEDELVKLTVVSRSLDRLGPRIGMDEEDIKYLKDGITDLLEVRKDVRSIGETARSEISGSSGRARKGGGWGMG